MKKFLFIGTFLAANSALASPLNWQCAETINGAIVTDGGKALTLVGNRLSLFQKDELSGDRKIFTNLPVQKVRCDGFIPCLKYVANGVVFFINLTPGLTQDGHLDVGDDVIDFACKSTI